jgi:hypothetical protein
VSIADIEKSSINPANSSSNRSVTFAGLIPPPTILAEYEKLIPGSAE